MGAGHAYRHNHFMLLDMENMEDFEREDFLEDIKTLLKLHNYGSFDHEGRDISHLGETPDLDDTIFFGIDYGGGAPCILADIHYKEDEAEEYQLDYEEEYESYKTRMDGKIKEAFDHLIISFPDNTFRFASSAWTSGYYSKERLYTN